MTNGYVLHKKWVSMDLPMSYSAREFKLIRVLNILKYYFYLDTFKPSWGGVRVYNFFYETFQNDHKWRNTP